MSPGLEAEVPAGGATPLPRTRDPREAEPARHPPATEGRGVSCGRTARRDAPLRSTDRVCGRPFSPSPSRSRRPLAHPREDEKGEAERRRRPRGPREAIADPRPRARPPASAPHLISRRVRAAAPHKSVQPARRAEQRRVRGSAHHPRRPPASRPSRSPLGMLPCEPPYYGATKLRALHAPLHSSRPPLLLCSLAPAYLLISLRRRPSAHSQPSAPPTDGRG